jgi:quinol monooxygenase YgiN
MFARNVSIRLKPGKLNEFTRTFDKEVLSILRKQPGFRDEIIFTSPGETELTAISLWDSKAEADAYNASAYPKVLQAVHAMLDGTPKVHNLNVTSSTMQHAGSGSGKAASASSATAARG